MGDIVTIAKATTADNGEREELLAYGTRVDPTSDTPIRVTEAAGVIDANKVGWPRPPDGVGTIR